MENTIIMVGNSPKFLLVSIFAGILELCHLKICLSVFQGRLGALSAYTLRMARG